MYILMVQRKNWILDTQVDLSPKTQPSLICHGQPSKMTPIQKLHPPGKNNRDKTTMVLRTFIISRNLELLLIQTLFSWLINFHLCKFNRHVISLYCSRLRLIAIIISDICDHHFRYWKSQGRTPQDINLPLPHSFEGLSYTLHLNRYIHMASWLRGAPRRWPQPQMVSPHFRDISNLVFLN